MFASPLRTAEESIATLIVAPSAIVVYLQRGISEALNLVSQGCLLLVICFGPLEENGRVRSARFLCLPCVNALEEENEWNGLLDFMVSVT
tara:strand:- start:9305 stop:9574 length:270 start_codon:yes stop_codon:yes gene_type:complete